MHELRLPDVKKELLDAFVEIQQPRSDYALKHFVVGDHHGSSTREYSQVVEELRRAYGEIKRGLLSIRKTEIERKQLLDRGDELSLIDAEMKSVDLDDARAGVLGKLREFACLYALWESYPKYTHEQLEEGELEYWRARLTTQAARDVLALHTGISVSSQHGMERAKLAPTPRLHELIQPVAPELSGT